MPKGSEALINPETSWIVVTDTSLAIAGIAMGESVRIAIQVDPEHDREQTARIIEALRVLADGQTKIYCSLDIAPLHHPRDNYVPDERVRELRLNDRYCVMAEDTEDGLAHPVVTIDHFKRVDEKRGPRAFNAIRNGIDEDYFYGDFLKKCLVYGKDGEMLGVHAERFQDLAAEQNRPQVQCLRNMGPTGLEVIDTLNKLLHFEIDESDLG